MVNSMPSKPPVVFPQERRLLAALGERLKLARLRRRLTTTAVAQRAGISRTSLYNAESGDPGATLGTYLRILAVLGLDGDINALAADDKVGRKLQDLELTPARKPRVRKSDSQSTSKNAPSSNPHAVDAGPLGQQDEAGTDDAVSRVADDHHQPKRRRATR
jgi:transcriptional regulator with XRE-family HTH domain